MNSNVSRETITSKSIAEFLESLAIDNFRIDYKTLTVELNLSDFNYLKERIFKDKSKLNYFFAMGWCWVLQKEVL